MENNKISLNNKNNDIQNKVCKYNILHKCKYIYSNISWASNNVTKIFSFPTTCQTLKERLHSDYLFIDIFGGNQWVTATNQKLINIFNLKTTTTLSNYPKNRYAISHFYTFEVNVYKTYTFSLPFSYSNESSCIIFLIIGIIIKAMTCWNYLSIYKILETSGLCLCYIIWTFTRSLLIKFLWTKDTISHKHDKKSHFEHYSEYLAYRSLPELTL